MQKLPLFFCPQEQVHVSFCAASLGVPQFVQNFPVFLCPQLHFHAALSFGWIGAWVLPCWFACSICRRFVSDAAPKNPPVPCIPIPTPRKPCIAPPLLEPAASIPRAIDPWTYPSRTVGSDSMAPWLRILISFFDSSS